MQWGFPVKISCLFLVFPGSSVWILIFFVYLLNLNILMNPKASSSHDGYENVYIISIQTILCNLNLGLSVSTKYLKHTEKLFKAIK